MEPKMYYQNTKAFRQFITWRQRYRLGKFQFSIHSVVLIIIIIISYSTASITSEKINLNNYEEDNNANEHTRRHSHKYTQTIDSLLSSLKNSKSTIFNIDRETSSMPRLPYDNFDIDESMCPTCYFDKSSDELRLEAIKRQILSKLGLKQKPKITLPVPREVILETLSRAGDYPNNGNLLNGKEEEKKEKEAEVEEELLESEPDDFYGRTREIISFAEPGQLLNGQTLLEFSHSSESDPGVFTSQLRVKSALLWVRVALNRSVTNRQIQISKNMTLWVFKVKPSTTNMTFLSGKDFDEHAELVGSLSTSLSNMGWQKIDITDAIKQWYEEGSLQKEKLRLLVDCSGCKEVVQVLIFQRNGVLKNFNLFGNLRVRNVNGSNKIRFDDELEDYMNISSQTETLDPNRPFLVVHTEPVVMKRSRRRALDCSGAVKGQCCKQNFFVSFKDLKWDDWIIAPKGYHANYCKGDCGGIHRTPDTYLNYHTHVIEEYRKLDRLSGIQPCCAPIKFSSMSLIYFGPDNSIIKRDLPKMVVEQCGCP